MDTQPFQHFCSDTANSTGASKKEESGVSFQSADGHLRPLRKIEADVICLALVCYRGNICEAARHLRIGRSTLYRKLDELGLDQVAKQVSHRVAS